MELAVAVPFPVLLSMASMQITTSVACPLRMYPYLFAGLSPPNWAVTVFFVVAVFYTISRSIGLRLAVALYIALAGTALIDFHLACVFAAVYFVAVHTPAHFFNCFRRGQRTSLALAVWLMVAAAGIMRVMRPRGNIVLTYHMQKLVVAHALTEWRVADWFEERMEERADRKRRRAQRNARRLWLPAWAKPHFEQKTHEA